VKILVTGAAGFIGFHLSKALLQRGDEVIGVDNLNSYYDLNLKKLRLNEIEKFPNAANFNFLEADIANKQDVESLFSDFTFNSVVNLAAQAGVRFSIDNPHSYVQSNLVGFLNILEGCRNSKVGHFVYASSSSVYGMNVKKPFSVDDRVDHPISFYAATKKSNELMAHSYSHLYNLATTGLRFFTVYGPYGRPDMAYYNFTKCILDGKSIDVFNNGKMQRDFTYIDDIVDGMLRILDNPPLLQKNKYSHATAPYKIYNIGNNNPVSLRRFISAIEKACGKKAIENLFPMQPGDVPITYANIDPLIAEYKFQPSTSIEVGIQKFVEWFIKHNPTGEIK